MPEHPMGTVERDGDHLALRYQRRLRHPVETVWRALTESEHLPHWLPCDIVGERRAGASIDLPFWPDVVAQHAIEDPVLRGEIRVWDPPHVFEWTWDTDLLRFELAQDSGSGTLLTFTTWIGVADETPPASTAAGWHVCLEHFAAHLDGDDRGSVALADPSRWERAYADLVGAAS
jgi:uncharacterized protein YndB with AHSA1/START domain